jgi:hypothetical protein
MALPVASLPPSLEKSCSSPPFASIFCALRLAFSFWDPSKPWGFGNPSWANAQFLHVWRPSDNRPHCGASCMLRASSSITPR